MSAASGPSRPRTRLLRRRFTAPLEPFSAHAPGRGQGAGGRAGRRAATFTACCCSSGLCTIAAAVLQLQQRLQRGAAVSGALPTSGSTPHQRT